MPAASDQVCEPAPISIQELESEPMLVQEPELALSICTDSKPEPTADLEPEAAEFNQRCEPVSTFVPERVLVEVDILEQSLIHFPSPEIYLSPC